MATFPMGAGTGLLSCPTGAGILPGLHARGAGAAAAALKPGCVAKGIPAALGAQGPGAMASMAGAGKSLAAKGWVAGGTTAGCKGLSLGLGIGLGFWGPVILAGLGAAAAYTLWKSRGAAESLNDDDAEIGEALSSR